MAERAMTAEDLTDEHAGWLVEWGLTWPPGEYGPPRRQVLLLSTRRWVYAGAVRVGLLSDDGDRMRTEHHMNGDRVVRLVRPVTAKAKRAAKAAGWSDAGWTWTPPTPTPEETP